MAVQLLSSIGEGDRNLEIGLRKDGDLIKFPNGEPVVLNKKGPTQASAVPSAFVVSWRRICPCSRSLLRPAAESTDRHGCPAPTSREPPGMPGLAVPSIATRNAVRPAATMQLLPRRPAGSCGLFPQLVHACPCELPQPACASWGSISQDHLFPSLPWCRSATLEQFPILLSGSVADRSGDRHTTFWTFPIHGLEIAASAS